MNAKLHWHYISVWSIHIKGIVLKWTYEKLLSGFLCLMSSASSCIYFSKGNRNIFVYNFIYIILYPDRTALKYCVPKRETKRGMRSFLKHLFLNSFNFVLPQFKKKLNGKILDLSSFFSFMFFCLFISFKVCCTDQF